MSTSKTTLKMRKQRQGKHIREGDTVVVIAGNERGRSGKVLNRVGPDKLRIQGLNIKKKHMRPSEASPKGGIVEMEAPIHISNVMIYGSDEKGHRTKVRIAKDGSKELVLHSKEGDLPHRSLKVAK